MAPKICRKTSEDHFLGVTPQKRAAKVARQLFRQDWENLGKNLLHPQEFGGSYTYVSNRPVTSVGHQEGRRVFWEGPKFFELCPIVLNDVQHIFLGGAKIF